MDRNNNSKRKQPDGADGADGTSGAGDFATPAPAALRRRLESRYATPAPTPAQPSAAGQRRPSATPSTTVRFPGASASRPHAVPSRGGLGGLVPFPTLTEDGGTDLDQRDVLYSQYLQSSGLKLALQRAEERICKERDAQLLTLQSKLNATSEKKVELGCKIEAVNAMMKATRLNALSNKMMPNMQKLTEQMQHEGFKDLTASLETKFNSVLTRGVVPTSTNAIGDMANAMYSATFNSDSEQNNSYASTLMSTSKELEDIVELKRNINGDHERVEHLRYEAQDAIIKRHL